MIDLFEPRPNGAAPFADYIDASGPCWEWTGGKRDGYGLAWVDKASANAHRVVYEALVGPIPDGLQIDHLCRNRACVNPDHLEPVTAAENTRRGATAAVAGGRMRAVANCPQGHPYDEANTYWTSVGWRQCRACHRQREGERYARGDKR